MAQQIIIHKKNPMKDDKATLKLQEGDQLTLNSTLDNDDDQQLSQDDDDN